MRKGEAGRPALALAAVTGFNLIVCILMIGTLSAVYSALGGIEGVIWTDFAQTVFLLGAAFMIFFLVIYRLDSRFETLSRSRRIITNSR